MSLYKGVTRELRGNWSIFTRPAEKLAHPHSGPGITTVGSQGLWLMTILACQPSLKL